MKKLFLTIFMLFSAVFVFAETSVNFESLLNKMFKNGSYIKVVDPESDTATIILKNNIKKLMYKDKDFNIILLDDFIIYSKESKIELDKDNNLIIYYSESNKGK